MTPITYMNDLRLRKAEYLMEVTSDPLESVAAQCGFQNYSHFYKLFAVNSACLLRNGGNKGASASVREEAKPPCGIGIVLAHTGPFKNRRARALLLSEQRRILAVVRRQEKQKGQR